ncbi:MAG TPA: hypothetical protein VFS43_06010 [Polyangiaceae bacterium]|nr:hypothetical protein [Polyangiaceae bacterium]
MVGDARAQVADVDQLAVGHDRRALGLVLQLADVARPPVPPQRLERPRAEAAHGLAQLARLGGEEGLREQRDVVAPLAQRRHVELDHVEPVVQVFAEAAGRDLGHEVLVGGRDDAHVDPRRPLGAQRLHLALLDRAQQLGLRRKAEVGDLVEEEHAAVGEGELAALVAGRAGEGALLVAEELGLDHRLGDGGAVERHEGVLGPGRERVQRARHQLFARAALAPDEHVRAGGRELADAGAQLLHRRAVADEVAERALGAERRGDGGDALVALGALERGAGQVAERGQEVEVLLGEAARQAPVVDVEQAEHAAGRAERHAHRRQDALAQQRVRRGRVAHDDALAPLERRLDQEPAEHHLARRAPARPHDAPQRLARPLEQAHQPALAAQDVDDRLEHAAEQRVRVFDLADGPGDVVKDPQPPRLAAQHRRRLGRGLVVHELGGPVVGLGERQQHLPDLHLVAVRELAARHARAVDEGAVRRAEVLHRPAALRGPERGVLPRDLRVLEHDRVLLVAAHGQALAQLDRERDAVRLADDKVRHDGGFRRPLSHMLSPRGGGPDR